MNDLVSVVIPTFSRPDMLGRAIESVLKQSYFNYEIIIVDDNGEDSKYQKITEEYISRYKHNKCIKYIKHKTNLGGCAARNTGIRNAKGKFIGFLDDDDEWTTDFLEVMMCKFSDDLVGAIYCDQYIQKREKIFYSVNDTKFLKGNVFENLLNGWCPLSTSLFIIRKECFDNVGGFDEELKSFQDYDMWLRIAQKYKFDYVNKRLVIKHENHGGEQVGFNPYNRRIALNDLKEKWNKRLSDDEIKLFYNFIIQHSASIERNLIIYNKQKKINSNYIKLYKNYITINHNLHDNILIFLVCLFGIKVIDFKEMVLCRFFKRYKFIQRNQIN